MSLLLGALDFVGSNLVDYLAKSGHNVVVLDDLSEGVLSNLDDIECEFVRGDICTVNLAELLNNIDVVYHLACRKMVYSVKAPLLDLEVNAYGTLRLLESARKKGVPVIYTSTGSVYGNATVFPTCEDHEKKPLSPYGVSKYFGEEYCKLYHRMYGLRTVILRLYSVYGPKQKAIGVIPKFIMQTLRGKAHTIEGDGTQKRCFTYVDDCVKAITTASEAGEDGEVYNIAGDKPYSIIQVSRMVHSMLHQEEKIENIKRKKGDLDLTYPSTEKLRKLGWKPKTDMKEGLKRTVEWIENSAPNNLCTSL